MVQNSVTENLTLLIMFLQLLCWQTHASADLKNLYSGISHKLINGETPHDMQSIEIIGQS